MRNILTFLTLFCLAFASTNVANAAGYDESRRTERFGLSFYDGRPLYVAYIKVYPTLGQASEHSFQLERLCTGQSLDDMANDYKPDADQGGFGNEGKFRVYGYYSVEADGSLKLLTNGSFKDYPEIAPNHWLSQYLLNYRPFVHGGDLGIKTYDKILPDAQAWARRGIMLSVLLLALSAGLNKFRELTSDGASSSENSAKTDVSSAAPQENRDERLTMRKIREAAKLGSLGGGLDERFLSETERREHDFITGKAFGLTFDDKVRASNKLFLEAFNRLPRYEQEALLQEWRVSSYTESYQGSVERRFIDWREGSAYDGATSRKQTDAFDNWFGYSDPFDGDEDGATPF